MERRAARAEEDRESDHPFVADSGDLGPQACGHQGDDRDHAARREPRVVDRLTRSGENLSPWQIDQLQPRFDLGKLVWGQSRQKVVVLAPCGRHVPIPAEQASSANAMLMADAKPMFGDRSCSNVASVQPGGPDAHERAG
jgi:hypothetical protein